VTVVGFGLGRYNAGLVPFDEVRPLTINSMTGYARVQGRNDDLVWTWEVKSVNGRGLELRCRLPSGYDFLEPVARETVQKRLKRGSVTLSMSVDQQRRQGPLAINEGALAQYVELARRWQEKVPELAAPRIDGLLGLRGVIEIGDTDDTAADETLGAPMLATLQQALDVLAAMRAAEGRRLHQVLADQLAGIVSLVEQAERSSSLDPSILKERLFQQVQAIVGAVPALPEERLVQEVALILAKADVREELDRLKAHTGAAAEMLGSGEPVGRKLDFLCQEFNREANTLCSKANDIELTRIGLAMKALIEQFREQVQNIE
jgi:uncharacterized protein (TIGR00255 family)